MDCDREEIKEIIREEMNSDTCLNLLKELCLENPSEKYISKEALYNKLLMVVK